MIEINEILQGRYRIIRQLGHGGMGTVYEASDMKTFGKAVALKEIMDEIDTGSENQSKTKLQEMVLHAFKREAKLLTSIDHDAFPQVMDYFTENNRQFLVMQLISGSNLAELLIERQRPFSVEEVLSWSYQLLNALDYLHNFKPQQIIHRDIKPQNLKLTSHGTIKLLDFGIAKGAEVDTSMASINQTFIAATMHFSPLEQILRIQDDMFQVIKGLYPDKVEEVLWQFTDPRSDIYAFGATIYNLLTAKLPIDARGRAYTLWGGNPDPLVDPREYNPEIPPEVSDIIVKAMAIDRENRFSSVAEMKKAFENISYQSNPFKTINYQISFDYQELPEVETIIANVPRIPDQLVQTFSPEMGDLESAPETKDELSMEEEKPFPVNSPAPPPQSADDQAAPQPIFDETEISAAASATRNTVSSTPAPKTSTGGAALPPTKDKSFLIIRTAAIGAALLLIGGLILGVLFLMPSSGSKTVDTSNKAENIFPESPAGSNVAKTNTTANQSDSKNSEITEKTTPEIKKGTSKNSQTAAIQPTQQSSNTANSTNKAKNNTTARVNNKRTDKTRKNDKNEVRIDLNKIVNTVKSIIPD